MADDDLSANADDGADAVAADAGAGVGAGSAAAVTNDDGASDPPSLEDLASELGWSPKENWRGDGGKEWVDAATFLKSNVDSSKALKRDLKATREASERAARAAATITEQALARQRDELLRARQDAFDSADVAAFNKADNQLRSLPTVQADVPATSTESRDFQTRNADWYGIDPIATQIAYNVCEMHSKRGADFATQLQKAEEEVRKRFPELFTPASKGPAQVNTSGTRAAGSTSRGPKGYADLPPEMKRAAQDFERRGRATKEEYAKYYWQENA